MTFKPNSPDVRGIFDFLSEIDYFGGDDPPCPLQIRDPGKKYQPRLAVIVGENASGKSLVRRIVKEAYRRLETECMDISVQGRRDIAYNILLTFVYGDEGTRSTGDNSAGTILGAMKTSRGRETPHAIFWDEPDLGLSEGWSACAGREIATFLQDPPKLLRGVFLVSHSRPLLRELSPLHPLFVYVGEDREFKSFEDWLNAPAPQYKSLEDLQTAGLTKFRQISRLQREREIQREKDGKRQT